MKKIKNLIDLINSFKGVKKIALIIDDKKTTYDELYKNIIYFANRVVIKSKNKKINVGIYTKDVFKNIIAYFGCIYANTIPVPISNFNLANREKNLLNDYKIKIICVDKGEKLLLKKIKILRIISSFFL